MAFLRKSFPLVACVASLVLASALPAAEAPLAPEVQQRLDLLKTGYETFVLNTSTLPYDTGVKALNEKVKPLLERESAAAAQRTDLDTLVRTKADLERLSKGQALTAIEAPPPDALKHTYAAYKLELGRLESAQKASLADAKRRYDKGLEQMQNDLTKAQDVAAALQIKQLREALVAAAAPALADTTTTDKEPASGENLIANGSFEKGTSKWEMTTHEASAEPKMVVDKKVLFHDKPTLRVTHPKLTDTRIIQKVKLKPGTRYRMSGFIKVQDLKDAKGSTAGNPDVRGGGSLCITGKYGSKTQFVTTDTWTEVSEEFKTQDETELTFECRFGYFAATVTGTAWFSKISLTEVKASSKDEVPQYWAYLMKPTDKTSLSFIELKPGGQFVMSNTEPATWEQAKPGGVITITFADKSVWTMTPGGDGTATLDRPDVGRRYMRIKQ